MFSFFRASLIVIALTITASFAAPARSAEGESADNRIQKLEQENRELREMIQSMQERMDQMEDKIYYPAEIAPDSADTDGKKKKKKEAKPEEPAAENPPRADRGVSETSERLDAGLSEGSGALDAEEGRGKGIEWLPSLAGEEFRLGGRLQFLYFDPEDDGNLESGFSANPGGSFQVEEMRLYLDADFKNNIRFYSTVDIEQGETGLLEAYVDFEELPLNSELRVGLQPRFYRPSRYTEYYPLNQAFWQSRDLGITWKGQYAPFFAYASALNGVRLNDRDMKMDDSDPILGDDSEGLDFNANKELSVGLGVEYDFQKYGKIELLGFGTKGDLSERDLDFLFRNVPGYPLTLNDDKEMAGVNLDYGIGEWDFFAQAIGARDGELERFGWYAEASYLFAVTGMKYLNSVRPLIRYGELDLDIAPTPFTPTGSLTWDREQWVFALISEISRNVVVRTEYMLNQEDTGGPDANNNEWLLELEIQF